MVHSIKLPPIGCFDSYVQPRSRKIKSKIGMGIPSNQSKIYPVAPASLILFVRRTSGSPFALLQTLNFLSEFFFCFAEFLLETPKKLVVLPLGECKVVIGQLTVFLFKLAFDFIPTALEL
jgi:hypothetical protein